jgi:SNF2 family DNA or RNA helicase
MRAHGCNFLKTDEVFDLPEQVHQNVMVKTTKEYKKFEKDSIVIFNDPYDVENAYTLVGDTVLTQMLYERQLCGQYNLEKLMAFRDLVESTDDRIIVFYNFNAELEAMQNILLDIDFVEYSKRFSVVNGKTKALKNYEEKNNSITFIQYQAGAMGLNLQKANKIIYFTPPLSSELFEQSKKRIHRIGQSKTCFYYYLICKNSVEERIYSTLKMRRDYTEALFEEEKCNG